MEATHASGAARRWVDPTSAEDVRYWAHEFGCSEWKLLDAITFVGMRVDDLRRHLAMTCPGARPN